MTNEIPPITDEMGQFWRQPDRSKIVLDDTHAMMERATFDGLSEYSCTWPSGVYEGKMWKRCDGKFDQRFLGNGGTPIWLLMWFGQSPEPGMVSVHKREIIVLD